MPDDNLESEEPRVETSGVNESRAQDMSAEHASTEDTSTEDTSAPETSSDVTHQDETGASDKESKTPRSKKARDKKSLSIMAGLLVAILAFAITVQVRHDDSAQDLSNMRGVELVEMLKSIDATNQRLADQIQELTATRNQLRTDSSDTAEAEKTARERADAMAILAGSAGAKGPGIQITITAPDQTITASVLLDAVQEMRDAGAEAIVINGVARVVAHTWFADDNDGVRVGGRILQPPFVIEVIGEPNTLEKAVNFRGGLTDRVQGRGGTVDVVTREEISITALADEVQGQYARPAQ